jgi:hypothetical protein
VERLLVLARALWPARPTLVTKHAVPAAFSLLNDTKGDGRAAANVLLAVSTGYHYFDSCDCKPGCAKSVDEINLEFNDMY